ncbi:MAG: tyrosine--tRNA ligase, partial [Paludibacteraceae bacterium]|nr:tyrosine--tRNA ligase [Paludibacteraceae bacterium]
AEFSYMLIQGLDFKYLHEHRGVDLQVAGSDQWGNITTGTDLIKKLSGNEAYALTCPLITKADGGKFGKTESGNVWLSKDYTSPYKFYQFWLNVSDDDAKRYIKIFTSLGREEIEALIAEHEQAPHMRVLQKKLAREVTIMVHSEADYNAAVEASNILFGNATAETLHRLDEQTFLQVFEGVERYDISLDELKAGIGPLDLLAEKTQIFPSKGEARKMILANGFSMNKEKLTDPQTPLTDAALLNGKYLLFQKGKKSYYLVTAR